MKVRSYSGSLKAEVGFDVVEKLLQSDSAIARPHRTRDETVYQLTKDIELTFVGSNIVTIYFFKNDLIFET
jgi:hypothetical protein